VRVLFHARCLTQADDLFEYLTERCNSHYLLNIAFIGKAAGAASYIPVARMADDVPARSTRPNS
jgi:hypothetical protein